MENREPKTGKLGLVLAAVAIAAFVAFTGVNVYKARTLKMTSEEGEKRVPVTATRARRQSFERILDLTGEIRPWNDLVVLPKIPGQVIEAILPHKGDRLKKGDLVAVLDDRAVRARIAEAEAGLEAARAGFHQAEAGLKVLEKDRMRLEALYGEKAVARQRLDHLVGQVEAAEDARRLAQARIGQAEAVVRQLRIALDDHRVVAPEDGTVIARYLDPGAISTPATPILRLADETRMKIVTFVTEKDFPFVALGMAAEIRVDAYPDRVFADRVAIVNPAFSPATRSNDIEIHMDNAEGYLRTGMFARVRLYLGKKQVTAVDREALIRMPGTGSDFLFEVVDGRAVLRNVQKGGSFDRFVEILDGIVPGAEVVVSGHGTLRDGDALLVAPSAEEAAKSPGGGQ
ncbi:MAG: efflux RND transporter periplasmic adaptor subunit [Desulfobacterales bacterium]|nr:efflux RND transporter periplasmic adaptor subunit [Desulfobacterales bacterium]